MLEDARAKRATFTFTVGYLFNPPLAPLQISAQSKIFCKNKRPFIH